MVLPADGIVELVFRILRLAALISDFSGLLGNSEGDQLADMWLESFQLPQDGMISLPAVLPF